MMRGRMLHTHLGGGATNLPFKLDVEIRQALSVSKFALRTRDRKAINTQISTTYQLRTCTPVPHASIQRGLSGIRQDTATTYNMDCHRRLQNIPGTPKFIKGRCRVRTANERRAKAARSDVFPEVLPPKSPLGYNDRYRATVYADALELKFQI